MLNNFNMDFTKRVVIKTNDVDWVKSPHPDVLRKPLEREGVESGHTTSVVKYLPGASFTSHPHPLGEEIFVIEGVFSDESGDYGAGTYIRNPPGSSHTPFSKEGCVIFVKLNQFHEDDLKRVIINTHETRWRAGYGNLKVMTLHEFEGESVALVKWPENERFVEHKHYGGEEIFVIDGEFQDELGKYPKGTWLRNHHLSTHQPWVEEETLIYVKVGHLANQRGL